MTGKTAKFNTSGFEDWCQPTPYVTGRASHEHARRSAELRPGRLHRYGQRYATRPPMRTSSLWYSS
jgi:hypothetical protein